MLGKESEYRAGRLVHYSEETDDEREKKHRAGCQAEHSVFLHSPQMRNSPHVYLNVANSGKGSEGDYSQQIDRRAANLGIPVSQTRFRGYACP